MKMKKLAALLLAGCLIIGNAGVAVAAGTENQDDGQNTQVVSEEEDNENMTPGTPVETSEAETDEKNETDGDQKKPANTKEDITQGTNSEEEKIAPQSKEVKAASRAAEDNSLDTVYVSAEGNDESGAGTQESPVASLAKAVSVVKSGGTIQLLTDLDAASLTYIEAKTVTVKGNGHSITRSDGFAQKNDLARGGYNPAIIEVANGASLRLENITINDAFRQEADTYLEQLTGDSNKNNEQKVQDAIIAAYHGGGTITLGSGTTL